MKTLFISDLHLDAQHPEITAQFLQFLDGEAREAAALYILGDLFEVWIGDDDPDPDKQRVIAALKALTASGVPCYLMTVQHDVPPKSWPGASSATRAGPTAEALAPLRRRAPNQSLLDHRPAHQR